MKEWAGRQRTRRKRLLDDLKANDRNLKGEALDGSLWRTRFGRDRKPVARQRIE